MVGCCECGNEPTVSKKKPRNFLTIRGPPSRRVACGVWRVACAARLQLAEDFEAICLTASFVTSEMYEYKLILVSLMFIGPCVILIAE